MINEIIIIINNSNLAIELPYIVFIIFAVFKYAPLPRRRFEQLRYYSTYGTTVVPYGSTKSTTDFAVKYVL